MKPGALADPERAGAKLLVRLDDYLPPVLMQLKGDVVSAGASRINLPTPFKGMLDAFQEAFDAAHIVKIEANSGVTKVAFGVVVEVRPIGSAERIEILRQKHLALLSFVKIVSKNLTHERVDIVTVELAETGLSIRRDGKMIETTMAQDRALATLMALGVGEWIRVDKFCELYSGSKEAQPDKYFGTSVGYLTKALPTLSWESRYGGERKIMGIRVETSLTSGQMTAFAERNRTQRKPARKRTRKPQK